MLSKQQKLNILAEKIANCKKCIAVQDSTINHAPGDGNPDSKVVFCGEACGRDETEQGIPFVGRAGKLLDNILGACGIKREDVFVLNILRCRPPKNRVPLPEEAANCRPFLDLQLKIINPQFIICLGTSAINFLLGTKNPIGQMRGKWFDYEGMKVLATYHPAFLLRNPAAKQDVWEDLQLLLKELKCLS